MTAAQFVLTAALSVHLATLQSSRCVHLHLTRAPDLKGTFEAMAKAGHPVTQRQSSVIDELVQIDEFFNQLQKPSNLDLVRTKAGEFCNRNKHLKIALITVIFNSFF